MTSLAGLPTLNQAKVDAPKLRDPDAGDSEIEESYSYEEDFERSDGGFTSSILDSKSKAAAEHAAAARGSHEPKIGRPAASGAFKEPPASLGGQP